MERRAEQTVAWIHRLLGWSFAAVGLIFLVAPNGTVRFLNASGAVFGVFAPAPESDLRFWLSLGFAYMVLVTILAARIAAAPQARRDLMPILAAGKLASSLTCFWFFAFSAPAFLYFLNGVVDGSIALLVLGCYLWLGAVEQAARRTAVPEGPVAERLRLVTTSMIPEGGAFAAGAAQVRLDEAVWRYFGRLHPMGVAGLAAILSAIEYAPYVFGPRRRRFSRLSCSERAAHLHGWETSRCAWHRQVLNGIKLAMTMQFYSDPDVCAAIGYDSGHLRTKLLAGPNAACHRARLDAGATVSRQTGERQAGADATRPAE